MFTVVVTVNRPEFIELVQSNLLSLELPDKAKLVVMVDNRKIDSFITDEIRERFTSVTIQNSLLPGIPGNISESRSRIAKVRNQSKSLVGDTEFVFSFEDDTVVPKNALVKLLQDWYEVDNPGFISGVQVGRQGLKILGAWLCDSTQFPTEFVSLGKNEVVTPIAEVSGAGMYCYLTRTDLYKEATYGWREPVGPDVWYGLHLRTKGYKNYVDQSLVCGHQISGKVLTPDTVDVVKARFYLTNGVWEHEVVKV